MLLKLREEEGLYVRRRVSRSQHAIERNSDQTRN